jgi:hypothetical protein
VRSLPWFGELQALSNLMFMLLAWDGKDYHWIDKRDTLALSV